MTTTTDRRAVARPPLTVDQRELAASAERWLWQELANLPEWFVRDIGRDVIEQEAWLAICKAASDFDPVAHPNVPFGAFARTGVRTHLRGLKIRAVNRWRVWGTMPVNDDGAAFLSDGIADHRRTETEPNLHIWCSSDYAEQRRDLNMRHRLVLFLRFVECWTLEECAVVLGYSREYIRQLENQATARLAFLRTRAANRRAAENRRD